MIYQTMERLMEKTADKITPNLLYKGYTETCISNINHL